MTHWLEGRGYWTADRETGFGAQATPHGCEIGTASLDFQGIRSRNGVFWIDLQAQEGGGGRDRDTYGQVMIQTRIGRVDDQTVIDALIRSLRGGAFRAVIRAQETQHLP